MCSSLSSGLGCMACEYTSSNWIRVSTVCTSTSSGIATWNVGHAENTSSTGNWAANFRIHGLNLLDLTEIFGAGKEPTKDWMDANYPGMLGSYGCSSSWAYSILE